MQPGPVARPVLVLDVLQSADGKIGSLIVAYGTSTDEANSPFLDGGPDLVIDTKAAAHALGLHKRTQFSMSPLRRKQLVWSEDYFVPEPYRRGSGIIAGSLNAEQITRVKECFRSRGISPFWSELSTKSEDGAVGD